MWSRAIARKGALEIEVKWIDAFRFPPIFLLDFCWNKGALLTVYFVHTQLNFSIRDPLQWHVILQRFLRYWLVELYGLGYVLVLSLQVHCIDWWDLRWKCWPLESERFSVKIDTGVGSWSYHLSICWSITRNCLSSILFKINIYRTWIWIRSRNVSLGLVFDVIILSMACSQW